MPLAWVRHVLGLAVILLALANAHQSQAEPAHAIAMHGAPALPADFSHFPYANPDAPKGGTLKLVASGGFDTLNPFSIQGLPARGIADYVFESLLRRSLDEPFTLYANLAKNVDLASDRSSIQFELDEAARFQDGKPVTPDDVIFSWERLKTKGRPNHRLYYNKVVKIERLGPRGLRFIFADGKDRELPLLLGLMPILPKHIYEPVDFNRTSLMLPVGSGPYRLAQFEQGRSLTLVRNPDYWGRNKPVNRGLYNVDEIRTDYFREVNGAFEAFKAGAADLWLETNPARWEDGYDARLFREGGARKFVLPHGRPSGMNGIALNSRRTAFADWRVRKAVALVFDGDWVNRTLYRGAFARTRSAFDNSTLAAKGPPPAEEQALLAPFESGLDPDVLAAGFPPDPPLGPDGQRMALRAADRLLNDAGFVLRDGVRRLPDGEPFRFEVMLIDRGLEKVVLNWARNLEKLGITLGVRTVDASQYEKRRQTFDFDAIVNLVANSLSPGNEQAFYWGGAAANNPGSRNYPGVNSPAVDAMIAKLITARDRGELERAARALDRALLAGWWVVPLFHTTSDRIAVAAGWNWPAKLPATGYSIDAWWRKATSPTSP